ncbi:hypothetical protein F5Y18DRAFT_210968 [Xylariaceae sp. FL1019]|nr:hypothetical protein F5Y18DRAFT_210968 [Xylariaceae sp. FL1019]
MNTSIQTRASGPRSKTGCLTCRKRHIRCDERHPSCSRCERQGMRCIWPKQKDWTAGRSHRLLPASIITHRMTTPVHPAVQALRGADVLYFDLYRHRVVHDVAGSAYREIWTRTLMREGLLDECVLHSILSSGALALAIEEDGNGGEIPPRNLATNIAVKQHYTDALRHHGKALSMFAKIINNHNERTAPRSVFLATMALTGFELLHGSGTSVGTLVASGQRLILDHVIENATIGLSRASELTWVDTDLGSNDSIRSLMPRMTMFYSLILRLPITQQLELLGTSVFCGVPPDTDADLETALASWRDYCAHIALLNTCHAYAVQNGTPADVDDAQSALLLQCSHHISWGQVLQYHRGQSCNYSLQQRNCLEQTMFEHLFLSIFVFAPMLSNGDVYKASRDMLQIIDTLLSGVHTAWVGRIRRDACIPVLLSLSTQSCFYDIQNDAEALLKGMEKVQNSRHGMRSSELLVA